MIIKPELVHRIRNYFNLNIYEAKAWLSLLSKGIASASEIAIMSNVPRSRTYDVLESLEKQGFAISKIGKPIKYLAVHPQTVIEKLKNRTIQKAEEKVQLIDALKERPEYNELLSLHNSSTSIIRKEDLSGSIKGSANIFAHAKEMAENAEKELIICTHASELSNKARYYKLIFDSAKNKKISLKVFVSGEDEEIKTAEKKHNLKLQKTTLPSKFFIKDRKQALFTLNKTDKLDEEIATWLNSDFFSSALLSMFEGMGR